MTLDRRALLAASPAGLAAALAACSPKPPARKKGSEPTAIRFVTDWRAEVEHGGFYQALASGGYARQGLAVKIIQGGAGSNVPQLLASGAADLGVGSNSLQVLSLAAERVPVKAVMATFQKDPQVLMAHPGTGVRTLADLKGRPILLSDAAVTSFWPWLKAKYGLKDDQVRKYSGSPAAFIADDRAIQQGYVFSEPITVQKTANFTPVTLLLADNGYPGYAGMVLAPDRLLTGSPEAVRGFVQATAQGWKDYLWGDPRPGDALIKRDNPEMSDDLLDQGRGMLRTYGIVGSGDAQTVGLGAMSDAGWARVYASAVQTGLYPKTLDYKAAYSLAFLPKSMKLAQ